MSEEFHIEAGYLPTSRSEYDFLYEPPRDFQVEFMDWLSEDDTEPISVVNAPTGGGKSATFHKLIKDSDGVVLLIYPTNALIRDQKEELTDELDVSVEHITGDTLSKHGISRGRELKEHFRRLDTDVVITNPDILQAVVQGMYIDPAGNLIEIFEYCSAIVYDEFHFYSDFAKSGILLQTHIAVRRSEKLGEGNIVFSSATPDESYFEIFDELEMDYRLIRSEPQSEGSKFRCETDVYRYKDEIGENRKQITSVATSVIEDAEHINIAKEEPEIAVICNSVKSSNQLYNRILELDSSLENYVVKDNGYDTNADIDETGAILITTSKAEVGVNFDITTLYMDATHSPASFIQRFGRAGRSSPATINIYGLGSVRWSNEMTYAQFANNVYETFDERSSNIDDLKHLIGLRAAYALYMRQDPKQQAIEDFQSAPRHDYWYRFIKMVYDNAENYTPREAENIITILEESLNSLRTLRGKTKSCDIVYQRGQDEVETSYSLLSSITQYAIKEYDEEEDKIILDETIEPTGHTLEIEGLEKQFKFESHLDLYDMKREIFDLVTPKLENFGYDISAMKNYIRIMDARSLIEINEITLRTLKQSTYTVEKSDISSQA